MKLYLTAAKRQKRIKNIDLDFYEIELGGKFYRICPCCDADFFSDEVLRLLLLSGDGQQISGALAVSLEGDLKIKFLTYNY